MRPRVLNHRFGNESDEGIAQVPTDRDDLVSASEVSPETGDDKKIKARCGASVNDES